MSRTNKLTRYFTLGWNQAIYHTSLLFAQMVVLEGIEPPLGTHLVRTVYKAVGASSYTIGPKMLKNEEGTHVGSCPSVEPVPSHQVVSLHPYLGNK